MFTIHNAEYGLDRIGRAAYYCQRFTTVSPSYAGEARPLLPHGCKLTRNWKHPSARGRRYC